MLFILQKIPSIAAHQALEDKPLYLNLHPVLKGKPDVIPAIDRRMIHQCVPCALIEAVHRIRHRSQRIHQVLHHLPLRLLCHDPVLHLAEPRLRPVEPLRKRLFSALTNIVFIQFRFPLTACQWGNYKKCFCRTALVNL